VNGENQKNIEDQYLSDFRSHFEKYLQVFSVTWLDSKKFLQRLFGTRSTKPAHQMSRHLLSQIKNPRLSYGYHAQWNELISAPLLQQFTADIPD